MTSPVKSPLLEMPANASPRIVREELARILESAEFPATGRRRELLQYLIDELLAGRGNFIKGYSIGVAVFKRGEDFNPDADPIVRQEARRLRHDLDAYYASEGRNNPLRITIPKGHYVPEIEAQTETPRQSREDETSTATMIPGNAMANTRSDKSYWKWAIFVGLAFVSALAFILMNGFQTEKLIPAAAIQPPAVAVLPFEQLSDNEGDRFLAMGISDRLVSELTRYPDIRIYFEPDTHSGTRPSSGGDVRYTVAGSLHSDGANVEVNARLVDAETGRTLWAENYERSLSPGSLFAIQGEIAASIASELGQSYGVIRNEISKRLSDEFVPAMPSYECVLRAYQYRRVLPGNELAGPVMDCLQKSVRDDPEYPEAWALLGYMYMDAVRFKRVDPAETKATFAKARSAAMRATTLDRNNTTGLRALGAISFYQGNYEEGEHFARLALEQNRNDPESLVQLGWRMAVLGKFEEGIPLVKKAIARSVSAPGWYYHTIALERLMHNDGNGMLDAAQKSTLTTSPLSYAMVAMAYGLLGDSQGANQALAQMNKLRPDYDPIAVLRSHQASDEIIEAAIEAMHRAGWRDVSRPNL